jgi:hypothetical protein
MDIDTRLEVDVALSSEDSSTTDGFPESGLKPETAVFSTVEDTVPK